MRCCSIRRDFYHSIQRFKGAWCFIACIPTFIETEAFNGVESYRLDPGGTVDTVFTFNNGGFDG